MSLAMKLAILMLVVAFSSGFPLNSNSTLKSILPDFKLLDPARRVVNTVGNTIKTAIAKAKNNIDQRIISVGNRLCSKVKTLLRLNYEQMRGVSEPDLDQLELNFISDELQAYFKLGSVAAALPEYPGYNHQQPLVIFVHGFVDGPSFFNFDDVNEAFQSQGKFNILALNASPLIRFLYLRSSTYVRFIGEKLGFILAAMGEAGLDPKDIHIVGHSLGSHIAGFAGKTYYNLTGNRVGRITSLDPAGPCFTDVDKDLRIKATDAEYVDVIHTNGGVFGLKEPVGHADFFPNGGELQPNCLTEFCSHNHAVTLFADSVRNPEVFPAVVCRDWEGFQNNQCTDDVSLMGYGSKPTTRGLYYLRTKDVKPHGLGLAGLVFQSLRQSVKTSFSNGITSIINKIG